MKFLKHLKDVTFATNIQKQKELWDVEGVLKIRSNERFKFDLRPLVNLRKKGHLKTKADKMVVEIGNQWIIIDIEELHKFLKKNRLKKVHLDDLLSRLEWNIIIKKNEV